MYVCFLNVSSNDGRTVNVRAYDTPVFHNLAPRPIKYRVSVPIPNFNAAKLSIKLFYFIYLTVFLSVNGINMKQWLKHSPLRIHNQLSLPRS